MAIFWYFLGYFWEKNGTYMGANSLNLQLEMLHDVSDWENKNHDDGAIMGYLKGPKKGP